MRISRSQKEHIHVLDERAIFRRKRATYDSVLEPISQPTGIELVLKLTIVRVVEV